MKRRILMSGAKGFVGSALSECLKDNGFDVIELTRSGGAGAIWWNPERRIINSSDIENFYAVIHLAGENIFGRWTVDKKKKILSSRKDGTMFLSTSLASLKNPPKVFVCASAVGYYGVFPKNPCFENSPAGSDFLADVCDQWEKACLPAANAAIRTVNLRFGLVLSMSGGVGAKLAPFFRLGLGAIFGERDKRISWIALPDLCSIFEFVLNNENIDGPVNAVTPVCTTKVDFYNGIAGAFGAFRFLSIPEFAIEMFGGEMGKSLLLADQFALPKKLSDENFKFKYKRVGDALVV